MKKHTKKECASDFYHIIRHTSTYHIWTGLAICKKYRYLHIHDKEQQTVYKNEHFVEMRPSPV